MWRKLSTRACRVETYVDARKLAKRSLNVIQGLVLHSVSYSGSWGQQFLPLDDFIGKAADLGYDGVMLMAKRPHLSVLDWTRRSNPGFAPVWTSTCSAWRVSPDRTSPRIWSTATFRIARFRSSTCRNWQI